MGKKRHAASNQQTILVRLLDRHYNFHCVILSSIYPQTVDGWGIYTIEADDGYTYILRAYRYNDAEAPLLGQVAVLQYLESHRYPAPRVVPTKIGLPLAYDECWIALVHSFVTGKTADFSPESLILLGKALASLHTLTEHILTEKDVVLPASRLQPTQAIQEARLRNASNMGSLPQALQPFCEGGLKAVEQVLDATFLPTTLLHGDCWPRNAVRADDGHMTMIDWDCAGIGPAILDVGYLLVACHLGKSELPVLKPDPPSIVAVVHGYCQQRRPSREELELLLPVIRYIIAQRALLEDKFLTLNGNWQKDVRIQKLLARYAASEEIARIAFQCFTSERI